MRTVGSGVAACELGWPPLLPAVPRHCAAFPGRQGGEGLRTGAEPLVSCAIFARTRHAVFVMIQDTFQKDVNTKQISLCNQVGKDVV